LQAFQREVVFISSAIKSFFVIIMLRTLRVLLRPAGARFSSRVPVHAPADVATWTTEQVAQIAREQLKLDDDDVEKLRSRKVDGRALLSLNSAKMERDGLSRSAEAVLEPFVDALKHGGENI
jgi:hypothetical protein